MITRYPFEKKVEHSLLVDSRLFELNPRFFILAAISTLQMTVGGSTWNALSMLEDWYSFLYYQKVSKRYTDNREHNSLFPYLSFSFSHKFISLGQVRV